MPNINIMIIEDEVLVALDLEDRIQGLGYDVAAVRHNSEKALAYLEIHTPDLILCDINIKGCLLYTSPSPRDQRGSRMPSSA